eukprot:CAMPEP_0185731836 /NCGR_PEP_ID=MMETSP1171-20130828/14060_1 /TAXON_ID=374046 /ORGANISM="Helicotheca tamensis, Strain CCMP826" /LENGTH=78 /DNA_ID=CAMNT_0028401183 /DNA_START=23 /DNA_END=256 /DNA_ORIENTATION=+
MMMEGITPPPNQSDPLLLHRSNTKSYNNEDDDSSYVSVPLIINERTMNVSSGTLSTSRPPSPSFSSDKENWWRRKRRR